VDRGEVCDFSAWTRMGDGQHEAGGRDYGAADYCSTLAGGGRVWHDVVCTVRDMAAMISCSIQPRPTRNAHTTHGSWVRAADIIHHCSRSVMRQ